MGGLAPICSSPGTLTRLKEEGRKLPTEVGGRWHLGSLGRPPRPTTSADHGGRPTARWPQPSPGAGNKFGENWRELEI